MGLAVLLYHLVGDFLLAELLVREVAGRLGVWAAIALFIAAMALWWCCLMQGCAAVLALLQQMLRQLTSGWWRCNRCLLDCVPYVLQSLDAVQPRFWEEISTRFVLSSTSLGWNPTSERVVGPSAASFAFLHCSWLRNKTRASAAAAGDRSTTACCAHSAAGLTPDSCLRAAVTPTHKKLPHLSRPQKFAHICSRQMARHTRYAL